MTILICFIVMLFVFGGMAVGVLCGRPHIRGTCGGLNGLTGMSGSCLGCAGACKGKNKRVKAAVDEVEL